MNPLGGMSDPHVTDEAAEAVCPECGSTKVRTDVHGNPYCSKCWAPVGGTS